METETDTTETQDVTEEVSTETPPAGETFDADYVRKLRAEAAKYRTEAKANAEKAKRLDELDEANKTEQQRIADRLSAAEQRAAEAESRLMRAEIAAEKGLSAKLARRLTGSTREELEADADELLAEMPADRKPPTADPKDTGAGAHGGDGGDSDDPLELARAAMGSRRR